eukprot:gene8739-9633_t
MGSLSNDVKATMRKGGRVSGDVKHRVIFALPQNNMDYLEDYLHHVSDPNHALYGKHLTREEVGEMTRNVEASQSLLAYLTEMNGCTVIRKSLYDEYIEVEAEVSVWEELFNTHFHQYHFPAVEPPTDYESVAFAAMHRHRYQTTIGAESYSLPEALVPHVEAVFNILDVLPPVPLGRVKRVLTEDEETLSETTISASAVITDGTVRPNLLSSFYRTNPSLGSSQTSQAVFASLGQYMSPADLKKFQNAFSIRAQNISNAINGHVDDLACKANMMNCIEANLDVQYIMGIGQNVPTTYYYSDLSWSTFLMNVVSMPNPPKVISISYGSQETFVSSATLAKFNTEAVKLGVLGVTLVAASGDDGANGYYYRSGLLKSCAYRPQFPASSPYVVSVGATMGPESRKAETACSSRSGSIITSGGGFSDVYLASSFQAPHVSNYLASAKPPSGFTSKGRAYPDVSLMGNNYQVYVGGALVIVSGTSASAPVFAAMLSLINSARRAQGLPFLGWVNPLLYTYSGDFANDIRSGDNRCTANATKCCTFGFNAAAGWDPVTGLGSVDFVKLLSVAMNVVNTNDTTPQTFSPTQPPTFAPTFRATDKTENQLSFSSILTLSNLTKASLSNVEQEAIVDSFAKVMDIDSSFITLSKINFIVSSSSNASGYSNSQLHLRGSSHVMDESPIAFVAVVTGQLTVTISLPLSEFPQYSNRSIALYGDLTSLLLRSGQTGYFMEVLESVAAENTTPLKGASVSELEVTPAVIDQVPVSSSSSLQPCNDQTSEDDKTSVSIFIFILTIVICSLGCLSIGVILTILIINIRSKYSARLGAMVSMESAVCASSTCSPGVERESVVGDKCMST